MTILIIIGVLALGVVLFLNGAQFGRLPRGERLARIEKLPTYRDGQLHNRIIAPTFTGGKGIWGMIGRMLTEEKPAGTRPSKPVPAMKPDLKKLDPAKNVVVWFGHSSSFLQIDERRVLVDPVFCNASPVNFVNKPFEGASVITPDDVPAIDYLVISHDHFDHLDFHTVKQLRNRIETVICPLGVGEHFERWGFDNVVELEWGGEVELRENDKIYCLESRHFSGRKFKRNQTLWGLFMLETPSRRVFLGGDGGYGAHYAEAGKRFGGVDLALVECGQYNENWAYTHMFPEQTVQAARDLRARQFVAVHNSKYALARHPWDEPLERAWAESQKGGIEQKGGMAALDSAAHAAPTMLTPMIGQVVDLDNPSNLTTWWRD